MTNLRPGQGADAFSVRFPPGMRDRIKVAADLAGRSMNAEIIATLEKRYPAIFVDVQAIDTLMHYVASAASDVETRDRVAEVNAKFEALGSPLRIDHATDGRITIVTEF